MKVVENVRQGSEEWYRLRRGRPTASQFKRIITAKRGEFSAGADTYIDELMAECFFPDHETFFGNNWTDRGNEVEPEARDAFRDVSGLVVTEVGFVTEDAGKRNQDEDGYDLFGCSPDGLVSSVDAPEVWLGGVELKVPSPREHFKWCRNGGLPDAHKQQVHGSMVVTGLKEWHFFSYCPGVAPLWCRVVWNSYTDKVAQALDEFKDIYVEAYNSRVDRMRSGEVIKGEGVA